MRARLWRALPALLGVLAFLALVGPALDPAVQVFYRDTGRLYYPVKKVIADRLAHGQLALWDPFTEAGVSLLGQMTPGLLHPFTLLYAALPFDLAFKLNHLLALLLAGAGAFLLSRRLGASRWAALLAALVYGGSGYLVSMAASNLPFALGPATVPLAVERFLAFLERPRPARLAGAAAALSLCAYAGDPQSMLLAGLIGTAWAVAQPLSRSAVRLALRGAALAALWGACAVGLAAPAALPAAAMLSRSSRAGGVGEGERNRFFVTPARFAGLALARAFDDAPELTALSAADRRQAFAATPFSEYFGGGDDSGFATTLYLGAPALLLALFAGLGGRRGRFLQLGALLLLLAAAGEVFGLQGLLFRLVPGFRLFRYAEKLMAFASLLLALAAAAGADAAFASRARAFALAALAGLGAAAAWLAAALIARHPSALAPWLASHGNTHATRPALQLLELAVPALRQEAQLLAVLAAVGLAGPRLRAARGLAAAVCGAGLVLANGPHLTTIAVELFHDPPPLVRDLIARSGPSVGRWRLYVQPATIALGPDLDPKSLDSAIVRETLRPQYESIFGIEGIDAYFSASNPDYTRVVQGAPRSMMGLLATRYFAVMPRQLTASRARELGFQPFSHGIWVQTLPVGPQAWLMDRAAVVAGVPEAIARLRQPGFEPRREALLRPEAGPLAAALQPQADPGRAVLQRLTPERLRVEVASTSASLLGISEHFDPGWEARIDGKEVPVVELDRALLAVPTPAGHHLVALRFWPQGLTWGLVILATTLALLGAGARLTNLVAKLTKIGSTSR